MTDSDDHWLDEGPLPDPGAHARFLGGPRPTRFVRVVRGRHVPPLGDRTDRTLDVWFECSECGRDLGLAEFRSNGVHFRITEVMKFGNTHGKPQEFVPTSPAPPRSAGGDWTSGAYGAITGAKGWWTSEWEGVTYLWWRLDCRGHERRDVKRRADKLVARARRATSVTPTAIDRSDNRAEPLAAHVARARKASRPNRVVIEV